MNTCIGCKNYTSNRSLVKLDGDLIRRKRQNETKQFNLTLQRLKPPPSKPIDIPNTDLKARYKERYMKIVRLRQEDKYEL